MVQLLMKRAARRFLIPLTLLALVAAGCGSDSNDSAGTTAAAATEAATTAAAATAAPATTAATTTTPAVSGDITVFAAASLTGAFNAVGDAFTAANPDAKAT